MRVAQKYSHAMLTPHFGASVGQGVDGTPEPGHGSGQSGSFSIAFSRSREIQVFAKIAKSTGCAQAEFGASPVEDPPEEASKRMKLRDEDKSWISSEIARQLGDRLAPKGWKKAISWLREYGLVSLPITALLALVAISVSLGIFTANHLESNARFQAHTEDFERQEGGKLDKIESAIKNLNSRFASFELRRLSQLEPKKLGDSLPALEQVSENPPAGLSPNSAILREVATNLLKVNEKKEGYWPAVLRFIQFASSLTVPKSGVPPPGTPYMMVSHVTCAGVGHCIEASHRAIELDGGDIPRSVFDHCRIKFTNNAVGLEGSEFIDCVFEMPKEVSQPSPYLKRSAKLLLASNLSRLLPRALAE